MSRSGYTEYDGEDQWAMIRWRGAVSSAIRGRRGQEFLREMLAALDALPKQELIAGDLVRPDGEVCGMGAVCKARGVSVEGVDPEDRDSVAALLGISAALAAEIAYVNDDEMNHPNLEPAVRFRYVRHWVEKQIRPAPQPSQPEEGEKP